MDEESHDLYIPSNTPLVTTSGRLLVESAWIYGSQWKVKIGWCPKIFEWSSIEPFTFSILKVRKNKINCSETLLDKYSLILDKFCYIKIFIILLQYFEF